MVAVKENQKTIPPQKPSKISWETFQEKYLTREDNFKYEWLNGIIEKTPKTMNKKQFFIQDNLVKFMAILYVKQGITGQLIAEGDNFFKKHHRRPDIAYYTRKQILALKDNQYSIPEFVIEIISPTDIAYKVNSKLVDYRKADVKIVWYIYPDDKEVHIYRENLLEMEVKRTNDICSAEPVIEGFKISVADIFKV